MDKNVQLHEYSWLSQLDSCRFVHHFSLKGHILPFHFHYILLSCLLYWILYIVEQFFQTIYIFVIHLVWIFFIDMYLILTAFVSILTCYYQIPVLYCYLYQDSLKSWSMSCYLLCHHLTPMSCHTGWSL